MSKQPHVLAVPFPTQGHVKPFMELSHKLIDNGIKVTLVNTEIVHNKIVAALPENTKEHENLRLVSVPDGTEPGDDPNDFPKFSYGLSTVMRGHIEDLIRTFNESDGGEEAITFVIGDPTLGWVLDAAQSMGIQGAAFWPASVGVLTSSYLIPKLTEDGLIDEIGSPMKTEMSTTNFMWLTNKDPLVQETSFGVSKTIHKGISKPAKWILCNSIYKLEPTHCDLIPNILPIGPLLETNRFKQHVGHFWQEDLTCLNWLDEQPSHSVIYIAFGSSTIFNKKQFDELALGLELLDQPFLWVIRPDFIDGGITEEFKLRGLHRRKNIVRWAPQQKVLAHPSIACFITHCGWNSIMEGLTSGIPFLCWPYYADQIPNQSYICDDWKVGLRLSPDENGFISRNEIKRKVENLLSNESIRRKALELKEMFGESISEGGSSWKNLQYFINEVKMF